MSYLLDTNVLSELFRLKPEIKVKQWFEEVPEDALFLSVLSLGELRQGVEGISDHMRREKVKLWVETELQPRFESRLLPINPSVADRWGRLQAAAKHPVPAIDSLLAATAFAYDLCMVTRNVKNFQFAGLEVIKPWEFV